MTGRKGTRTCWIWGLVASFVRTYGGARSKNKYGGAVPPDSSQGQAVRNKAGFSGFLHDMTHVSCGRVDPDF